jgi:hypothetical protein
MIHVKDRSDKDPNTGVITGRSDLNRGYVPPPTGKTPEPVNTASDDLDPSEGHHLCEGGESPRSGPQSIEKAQQPVTARPDAAPAGMKVNISGRSTLARGPAVSNPDNSAPTVSSR